MDTSTSALISKAVTRPIIASRIIGTPHKIIAIQAASNGNGVKSKILITRARPEITNKVTSRFVPPHSKSSSNFSKMNPPLIYPYGYIHIVPIGVWVVKRVLKNLERIVTIQP